MRRIIINLNRRYILFFVVICGLVLLQLQVEIAQFGGSGEEKKNTKEEEIILVRIDDDREQIVVVVEEENYVEVNNTPTTSSKKYENIRLLPYNESSPYSSYHCLNGFQGFHQKIKVMDYSARQCAFTNVIWSTNGTLIYHRDPNSFEESLSLATIVSKYRVPIVVSNDAIHPGLYGAKMVNPNQAIIIYSPDCELARQPGHDFDDIWTAFNDMISAGFLSLDNHVVFPDCTDGTKFWGALAKTVWKTRDFQPPNGISTLLGSVLLAPRKRLWLTFPTFESGWVARVFRDRAYVLNNISISRNGTFRIGIRAKRKRHRLFNHEALVGHLKQRYPNAMVIEYSRGAGTDFIKMTVQKEISSIAGLDVFITP